MNLSLLLLFLRARLIRTVGWSPIKMLGSWILSGFGKPGEIINLRLYNARMRSSRFDLRHWRASNTCARRYFASLYERNHCLRKPFTGFWGEEKLKLLPERKRKKMAKKLNEHGRTKTSEWQQIIMKAASEAREKLKVFFSGLPREGCAFCFNPFECVFCWHFSAEK